MGKDLWRVHGRADQRSLRQVEPPEVERHDRPGDRAAVTSRPPSRTRSSIAANSSPPTTSTTTSTGWQLGEVVDAADRHGGNTEPGDQLPMRLHSFSPPPRSPDRAAAAPPPSRRHRMPPVTRTRSPPRCRLGSACRVQFRRRSGDRPSCASVSGDAVTSWSCRMEHTVVLGEATVDLAADDVDRAIVLVAGGGVDDHPCPGPALVSRRTRPQRPHRPRRCPGCGGSRAARPSSRRPHSGQRRFRSAPSRDQMSVLFSAAAVTRTSAWPGPRRRTGPVRAHLDLVGPAVPECDGGGHRGRRAHPRTLPETS